MCRHGLGRSRRRDRRLRRDGDHRHHVQRGFRASPPMMRRGFQWQSRAAQSGGADSLISLALQYAVGQGCGTSNEKAGLRSADQGAANAGSSKGKRMVGLFYSTGRERGQECRHRGADWYQKAAEQGDEEALTLIGERYMTGGEGTPKDPRVGVFLVQEGGQRRRCPRNALARDPLRPWRRRDQGCQRGPGLDTQGRRHGSARRQ